jgi:hypothetical protein
MAVREPRHPLEKRDLLHADPPHRARLDALARQLLSEERYGELVDYLEVTKDAALAAQVADVAVERGSAWLLAQVERVLGQRQGPEPWERLSASAAARERWFDAVRALEAAGKPEEAEALRQEHCPEYEPFRPLGK